MLVFRSMKEAAKVAGKQRGTVFKDSFLWKLMAAEG